MLTFLLLAYLQELDLFLKVISCLKDSAEAIILIL